MTITKDTNLNRKVYKVSLILAMLFFIGSTVINFLMKANPITSYSTLFISIILIFSLFLVYRTNLYKISQLVTFTIVIIFAPIFWIYDGGIGETVSYYMLSYITVATVILSGWEKKLFLSLSIFMTIAFFIIELLYPGVIIQNTERTYSLINKGIGTISVGTIIIGVFSIFLFHYKKNQKTIEEYNKKLEYISRRDPLTGLSNRRDIVEKASIELERLKRTNIPFSLIIGDIDNFKRINDKYGHECGDRILKKIAKIMQEFLRKYDIVARWGGEEFLILLPETNISIALSIIKRLKEKLSKDMFSYEGKCIRSTLTFGVVECKNIGLSFDKYVRMADIAMYKGKKMGKNCIVVYKGNQ